MIMSAALKSHAHSDGCREAVRQCVVTRVQRPVGSLIRFVVGPDGAVTPDLKRKLPGRGVWTTCARDVLDEAVRCGHFARAFKSRVNAAPELPELVENLLRQAALSRLSLANKAGAVVAGFAKIEHALAGGQVAGLVHASDGSADGARKLDGKFLHNGLIQQANSEIIRCFNVDELSLALGRSNVVHAAVIDENASRSLIDDVRRLNAYRGGRGAYENSPAESGVGEE